MKALYELLAKVGSNPKLRAWAMEQLIKLKKVNPLRPKYKENFQHAIDKNKVKDILDPKWLDKEYAAKKAYSLKNKVLDITKAKDKLKWLRDEASLNKAKFHGKNFRGWVDDSVKKFGDDIDDIFKKDDAHSAWFNKTLGDSIKGNKKATIEIDRYFATLEKTAREKVIPFWPRKKPFKTPPGKAEGGIAGLEKGGSAMPSDMDYPEWFNLLQGPKTEEWPVDSGLLASAPEGELFMHEEFLEAVKQGFRGTYDEYIDQIDRSPADYMGAAGGRVGMLAGGLLRTGIMEALYPLLKGSWKGTLGSYRELLKRIGKQEVREDVDKVMPTIKSSRAVNLAKSVREELLSKIRGYKEGFVGAIKSRKTGDQGEELKYLIKETKKDIKHIDDFILKKEAGVATKHAEGGRIGFKKGTKKGKGLGSLLTEMYRLFEIGPLLGSPELVDLIQKIPFEKGGRAGFDEGGSTQKEIDKALVAIEKLKSSLMPESYEALIEVYKDKQKELDIGIMESAGGLGEMLGEGGRAGLKKGGRIGFQRAGSVPYLSRGWSQPGVYKAPRGFTGMQDILGIGGTGGILALRQKDKDKKTPQKKEEPNYPEPKPPFKKGDLIIDFILANRRQPKPSEEGRLKEILRVAKEKAEGITSLFNENLHGINTQRFIEGAKEAPQKLLEDLVEIKEEVLDPKTNKVITQYNTYKRSDKTRPPTEEEAEQYEIDLHTGGEMGWYDFGQNIEELDAAVEEAEAYEEQMRRDYYSGALDKYVKPEELEKQRLSRQKKIDKVLDKAYEEVFYQKPVTGDYKYDADTLADSIAEELGKELPGLKNAPFDEMPVTFQRQIYDSALKRVQQDLGMKNVLKKIEQKMKLSDFDVKDRKKNAAGGSVGWPPVQFNPEQQPPVQGPGYETNRPKEAGKEILRRYLGSGVMSNPIGGKFDYGVGYGEDRPFDYGIGYNVGEGDTGLYADYGIRDDGENVYGAGYHGDNWEMGVSKEEGSDPFFQFKKKFDQGGIARRPNAVPPLSGPTPQGLTFLLGDDIVKNRIT